MTYAYIPQVVTYNADVKVSEDEECELCPEYTTNWQTETKTYTQDTPGLHAIPVTAYDGDGKKNSTTYYTYVSVEKASKLEAYITPDMENTYEASKTQYFAVSVFYVDGDYKLELKPRNWIITEFSSEGYEGEGGWNNGMVWYNWDKPGIYTMTVYGKVFHRTIKLRDGKWIAGPFYASYQVNIGNVSDACFLENTKIAMADGSFKNIEDIQTGDEVVSFDLDSNECKTGTVSEVFHHAPEEMTDYYLILNDDLRVTPNHPFLLNGEWIEAENLKIGDTLGDVEIKSIQHVFERVPTYNFEVVPYHNYQIVWNAEGVSIAHNAANENITSCCWTYDKFTGTYTCSQCAEETCFLGDTKIAMSDGSIKMIKDVVPGDVVKAFDEKTGTIDDTTVKKLYHHMPSEMGDFYLVINKALGVTPNHLLYSDGKWIKAANLKAGDVIGHGANMVEITSIEKVFDRVETFDLECYPLHNYLVGFSGINIIAHNASAELITPNQDTSNVDSGEVGGTVIIIDTDGGYFIATAKEIEDGYNYYDNKKDPKDRDDPPVDPLKPTDFDFEYFGRETEASEDYYLQFKYTGTDSDGDPYIRIFITKNDPTDYALISTKKVFELEKTVSYQKAKETLLGQNIPFDALGNVDFRIKITPLDGGTEILDYGSKSTQSTIISQYRRVITLYQDLDAQDPQEKEFTNLLFGTNNAIHAVLEVTVFK